MKVEEDVMNADPKSVNQEKSLEETGVRLNMFNPKGATRAKKILPERKPEETPLNPFTLRRLLTEINNGLAGGNHTEMSERLLDALEASQHHRPGRNYGINLTRQHLGKVHNDTTHISYYLLEAYAEILKIPTGLLLLFSRLKSIRENPTDRDVTEINKVMNFLEAIAERWDEEMDMKFDIEELIYWSKAYETAPYDRVGKSLL